MGITVEDLLHLSSLKQAKVVAGGEGLSRIVASLSVLEYADPDSMVDAFFRNDEYYGSEIVITGFMNNPRDTRRQCAVVRRLAEAGEVGLILYYVGIFMPEIPEEMKRIADEYHFVLIVMPENRMDFRYSDAISEIMEAIVRDRLTNTAFVAALLDQVSRLPGHQRTVGTMLKMLSERVMASLVLTDQSMRVLNEAFWPLNKGQDFEDFLARGGLSKVKEEDSVQLAGDEYRLWHYPVSLSQDRYMELFILKEGQPIGEAALKQIAEAVQLSVNIWSTRHDEVDAAELVRAILQDEPMKMRRLASILHIDVASIHSMMIFHMDGQYTEANRGRLMPGLQAVLSPFFHTVVQDLYEGEWLVFTEGAASIQEEKEILKGIRDYLSGFEIPYTVTACNHLADTTAVREAFLLHRDYIEDAGRLFPEKEACHLPELKFARSCRRIIAKGEEAVKQALEPLAVFRDMKDGQAAVNTLEAFLLDARLSPMRTGELLYLHKNTVKYRIQQYSDTLGFHIGDFPDTLPLYYAAAVDRLLSVCPKRQK